MLSAFPMEKEDILEVASIAVHFETHFPTAAKALLDKCTSFRGEAAGRDGQLQNLTNV